MKILKFNVLLSFPVFRFKLLSYRSEESEEKVVRIVEHRSQMKNNLKTF